MRIHLKRYRKHIIEGVGGAVPVGDILHLCVLNGYSDNSKDTWIRHGTIDDKSADASLHVGLCNPFAETPQGGAADACANCECDPTPPAPGFTFTGKVDQGGVCKCVWTSGSPPFQQIMYVDAQCSPPIAGHTRSPTRSLLFFKLLDSALSYAAGDAVHTRLPDNIAPPKIKAARLVLTIKTNNGWPTAVAGTPAPPTSGGSQTE